MTIRPPVVAVLGHVDHGKTSLISKIYQKDLTRKESGGISQHVNAYQIDYKGKKITFIDTPGHVAFSQMRTRGAQIADLVILVVSAEEGVKPQTLESLKHIQQAKIPYLIAINKIDLPKANVEKVKANLAENNILIEGMGGDIVTVPVSAKTGQGIDQLLEMIMLLAEMAELKTADKLEAVVIESKLDIRRGPVATVIVRSGELHLGQQLFCEEKLINLRAMFDCNGNSIQSAAASQPVEIWGFKEILPVGAVVCQIAKPAKVIKEKVTGPNEENKKLKIILKADVAGTLEAILASLSDDVLVIHTGVGNILESDILLAITTKAAIVGFNVAVSNDVKKLAESEKIKIVTYKIIYELLEDLEKRVLKILEPTIDEQILGEAEIMAEFKMKNQRIAGAKVKSGEVNRVNQVHLKRNGEILGDLQIVSLKTGKTDIGKVKTGEEFGVVLKGKIDFKIGDVLISYLKAAD